MNGGKSIPHKMLALDPGKNTGYALFVDAKIVTFGTAQKENIWALLERYEPDTLLYENYRVRPPMPGQKYTPWWSSPVALELIGVFKAFAGLKGLAIHVQEPSILPVGCAYLQIPYTKGKHLDDHLSAMAHGAFWLVTKTGMNPQELRDIQADAGRASK